METTIALPGCPRPMKWATISSAIFSRRSSRVIRLVLAAQTRVPGAAPAASSSPASSISASISSLSSWFVKLQFRDAVLIVERHGGAVVDRLLEVVDADVVAEDLRASLSSPPYQRGTGEADKGGVWQGIAHIAARTYRTGCGAPRRSSR